MAISREIKGIEQIIEKIVFDEDELEALKIAIKRFNEGTISSKQLKQNLLNCRGRIVEDILTFLSLDGVKNQIKVDSNFTGPDRSDLASDKLRKELAERNDLLEVVAKRINSLALKAKKKPVKVESLSMGLEEAIRIEIERVFSTIKVDTWLDMCGYDDYKFFVKLYPKLEGLYKQRFGESEKTRNNNKDGKEIMANKMVRLGFPEEIETLVVKYVAIRNNFHHSMRDITPSNLKLAREAFVKVFVYLIVSNLDSKLVASNRKTFYSFLKGFFSETLKDNPIFRKKMLERLKTVFDS